jgi:hypothetical protein
LQAICSSVAAARPPLLAAGGRLLLQLPGGANGAARVRAVVEAAGGRFFERPQEYHQEPHWPFARGEARYDWILRFDADEFPSEEMQVWLKQFRNGAEPAEAISGYTCIWPLWNKDHAVTKKWPAGRQFLFQKQRVRFFGMVEQAPIPDGRFSPLDLVLRHQPTGRASHNLHNLLVRKQAYRWRECIARSLLGKPTDLACWRWTNEAWPLEWEQIRRNPLKTAFKRLLKGTASGLWSQWRAEGKLFPFVALSGPLHHALICINFRKLLRKTCKNFDLTKNDT